VNGPLEIRRTVLGIKGAYREAKKKASEAEAKAETGEGGEARKIRLAEIIPLDDYLGLKGLPFKMSRQMMIAAAFWGQHEGSYKSAETIVQTFYGLGITDSLIREVTDYAGKVVFEEDCKRAENIARNERKVPAKAEKEGVLYGFADGAAINTRERDEAGSSWRENKLGECYSSDHTRKRKDGKTYDVLQKEYCDYLGSVEEFEKHFYDLAVRNGYGRYKATVIISDGAAWIRTMCDELFPDAVQILDLFHLEENIYRFGKQLFKDDASNYTPWAEEIIALIKESKTDEALERLKPYKDKQFAVAVVNPYRYLLNNKDRVDYAGYRQKGYRVGSGPIESGNKTVLQKRCKLAGMRWNVPSAQHVLSLRAKEESGLWEKVVRPLLLAA
jgi:hypothetical protein